MHEVCGSLSSSSSSCLSHAKSLQQQAFQSIMFLRLALGHPILHRHFRRCKPHTENNLPRGYPGGKKKSGREGGTDIIIETHAKGHPPTQTKSRTRTWSNVRAAGEGPWASSTVLCPPTVSLSVCCSHPWISMTMPALVASSLNYCNAGC